MPRQMKITAVIRSPRIARRNIVWWARILFAVAVASPRTISLLGIYSRVNGAVNTIDKYTAPAMRAAFLVGCMRASPFSFLEIRRIRAVRDNAAAGLLER